jgi:alcohol dehydrogenase class IV
MAIFRAPKLMLTGWGVFETELANVLAEIGVRRPLLVTDPVVGKLATVNGALTRSGVTPAASFDGIPGEPTTVMVDEGVARLAAADCDGILAIGGGAVMDAAKAIALLAANGGSLPDYMGVNQFPRSGVPLVAVPTTAGTGSEVTRFTVVIDPVAQVKMLITDDKMVPAAAIVDASLTVDAPPRVSASAGVDALTHAIEAYVSRKANPMTDGLALTAVRRLAWSLPVAIAEPNNQAARSDAAIGALEAGLAFSNASVALVHGMSRPLGAVFGVPHGMANAMLLPTVMAYSADAATQRYRQIAAVLDTGFKVAASDPLGVDAVARLCQTLGIPGLGAYGIPRDELERTAAKMATDALASGSPGNNPRIPEPAEIVELYRSAY